MTKTKYTREQLLEVLRAGDPVVVTFTKVDGTKRDMRCTINDILVPEDKHPKGTKQLKENLDVIRVYDLDSDGWRSFRVDSVTGYTPAPLEVNLNLI